MKYVEKPNLPRSRVGVVAINFKAYNAIKKLNYFGINTIEINSDSRLPKPVDSHADLQLVHLGSEKLFTQNEHLCTGELERNFNLLKISSVPGNKYPEDVRLNCTFIGDKLICNTKTVAYEVLEYAYKNEMKVINVNQGYSRCSICVVDENSIITDDESIFIAAGKFLNDVQLISKGSIRLDGYEYGFIGGCCGKIDKSKIAFNGSIDSHKDYNLILDFLSRRHVECIELHREPLEDIGGILPLMEFT